MFRQLNEKIFRFERSFIDPHGLPDRLQFKHVIFAPSSSDTYSSAALPGLDSRLSVQNFHSPMGTIDESVPFAELKWESYKPFMMQCITLIGPTILQQKMWKNNSQRSGRFFDWDFCIGYFRGIFWKPIKSFFIYNAAENIKTDMVI